MTQPSTTDLTWYDQRWQGDAHQWIAEQLAQVDHRILGPIEQPHVRPWSTALRVLTDAGPVWFKAGAPACSFEAGLACALADWVPKHVLRPFAADLERGWLLLPDGGPTLRAVLDADRDLHRWETVVRDYAELQITVAAGTEGMLALGVPDLRPDAMPGHLKRLLLEEAALLVGAPDGLAPDRLDRLRALLPEYARWCRRLAESGIPASVQHDDLHDGNVFAAADGYRFFDWGDASVAHPFGTLLVTLRSVAARFDLSPGDAVLRRIQDAYLESWTGQHDRASLLETLRLAREVTKVSRALSWRRALTAVPADGAGDYATAVPGWLEELLEPEPA